MKNLPKVSVIIPLYKAEEYIAETLESVLNQTYRNIEIIIVDDCGNDNSVNIVRQYQDSRIKMFHNKTNQGIAYSRNRALANCTGEYIALLDDDDIALESRIEKQIAYLMAHPDIIAVGGNAQWIDQSGKVIRDTIEVVQKPEEIKMYLLFRNLFNNSEMTFRRSVIDDYHIQYSEDCLGMEDFLFWIKVSKIGKISNIPDLVLKKRVTDTNETSRTLKLRRKERKQKYLELQRFSFSASGFVLEAEDEKVLSAFFDEDADVCKNFNQLKKMSDFMIKIIVQARGKKADICDSLEKWFEELLAWNFESVKDIYLAAWKSRIDQLQPCDATKKKQQNDTEIFSTDLLMLKEMSRTFAEKEAYIRELLESQSYLKEHTEEQEHYMREIIRGKEWLEKQNEEQQKYIQELNRGNEWLEKQNEEQQKYIQQLIAEKERLKRRS